MTRKSKAKYSPPKIKVYVNGIVDIEDEINEIFEGVLNDYCNRFKVKVRKDRENSRVMLSLIQGGSGEGDLDGLCAFDKLNKVNNIAMQVRCIILENMEPNDFVMQQWLEIVAHEMVHACQTLTGREMKPIEQTSLGVPTEDYYFDPDEVEARILQSFYANRIRRDASLSIYQKIRATFEEEDIDEFDLLELINAKD